MPSTLPFIAAALLSGAALLPPQAQAQASAPRTVYLYGASALDRLRARNPNHYAQAMRILAAANQLCAPGPDELHYASNLDVRDLRCMSRLLRTSNPPKWQIEFRLDQTRYIALVTVTDNPARAFKADERKTN